MTKREMFETIASINSDNAEIVEFCEHEIKLLDSRKGKSKTPTKTQKENEVIMDAIEVALGECEGKVTVTELIGSSESLRGYTNQKMSALLRKMVEAKRVVKSVEGKKAYFSLA